jgi:hypothetical protein
MVHQPITLEQVSSRSALVNLRDTDNQSKVAVEVMHLRLILLNCHHRLKKLSQYALGEQSMKSCYMTVDQYNITYRFRIVLVGNVS